MSCEAEISIRFSGPILNCREAGDDSRPVGSRDIVSLCQSNPKMKLFQSWRSACSGSTFVARRAGIQQANSATPASSDDMNTNVAASTGLTS